MEFVKSSEPNLSCSAKFFRSFANTIRPILRISSNEIVEFKRHNFYYALEPTIRCCRGLGIFPLILKGTSNNKKYSASYFHLAYGVILMILSISGLTISSVKVARSVQGSPAWPLVLVTVCMQCSLMSILMLVIYTSSMYHLKTLANTIELILSQDLEFEKLGSPIDYSTELRCTYVHLGISSMILGMAIIVDMFCVHEPTLSSVVLFWFSWITPIVITDLTICLFTRIVLALRSRFVTLNQMLENMIEEVNLPIFETMSTHRKNASKLRFIAIVHGILCEATNNINRVFGFSIVAIVAKACVVVITTMYEVFRHLKYVSAMDSTNIMRNINWGSIHFFSIVYLVTVCSWTQIQTDRAAKLIHKMNVHEMTTPLTATVQMFSMQLNHQKVKFTALGFFRMDPSFLRSLVGAVTTYLIIMIQLDST